MLPGENLYRNEWAHRGGTLAPNSFHSGHRLKVIFTSNPVKSAAWSSPRKEQIQESLFYL